MNNKKTIYTFLLLLPIIDVITSIINKLYIPSISIGGIIKILFMLIMLYYLIFKSKSKKKKIFIIYICIVFMTCLCYILNNLNIINKLSILTEIISILKLIFYPILFSCLYCFFDDKGFSKNEINKILTKSLLLYVIFLFIPYITGTSFSTYNNDELKLYGQSGWYYSANELSVILVLIYPFIYTKFKDKKIFWIIISLLILYNISNIGTKVSMFGMYIVTIILLITTIFYKNKSKKNLVISSIIIFIGTIICFSTSSAANNIDYLYEFENKQNNIIDINDIPIENIGEIKNEFYNKYIKALLSDRDIYFKLTLKTYQSNFNLRTLLLGQGYYNEYNKSIEIDPLDIFFKYGIIMLILIMLPVFYCIIKLIKIRKFSINTIFYILMIGMAFSISFISGHVLMVPSVSLYIIIYFMLLFNEIGLIKNKNNEIEKNKITIYALHLNYGGIEKNICAKANILSKKYNVEIIALYKLTNKPVFKLNKKVKVKYLTENIKPNKEKFINAIKDKNIKLLIKEGLYSLKVLYLKHELLIDSMSNCNSEIVVSTRIDFTEKLIKHNNYNNIKIAEEHIYHNNNKMYFNKLNRILKKIDYLMPSSNYLTSFYKNKYLKYSYKIITNTMPIESNYKVSTLTNKNILSVGRLSKEKAFDDLIKIFSKINNKEWCLNIVGDGPEYTYLSKLIEELNLTKRVKLLGFKTSDELNNLYEESALYVMTSLEESFGLVLLEAASHGLPIIAFDSALGANEILSDKNGILIKNRNQEKMLDYLNKLTLDITLRKEYQKKSLQISDKYKYENIERTILDFYSNLTHTNLYTTLYKNTKNECYKLIDKKIENKEKTFIVTANPETYMISETDKEMNSIIYNRENLIVPDGIAIVKTANLLGNRVKERITGIDIAEYLLKISNKKKLKVYLFGASAEVMEKLEKVIVKKYPNINLVGASHGYIKDKDSVMEYIKTTEPDIVMLALGIPLQEKLINKYISNFKHGIFIGVGGSFDVLSGTKKRAPRIFINLNLEWLYRIICEPKRISRFIKHNMKFILKIIKEKK